MSLLKWPAQAVRSLHLSASALHQTSKLFHRLSKYVRKVEEPHYTVGQPIVKGMKIPRQQPTVPVYHYEARFFKRQNRGLYGGLQRRSGHTCSEAENKNKRTYLPNIVNKRLWLEALNRAIKLRVSTKVLKTITREGGLDEYLTKATSTRVKTLGLRGWELKYQVLQQRELRRLPNYNGLQVLYVHPDGREFVVDRAELVDLLYPLARRDCYHELNRDAFVREASVWTYPELVAKLDHYGLDFTPITVQPSQRVTQPLPPLPLPLPLPAQPAAA